MNIEHFVFRLSRHFCSSGLALDAVRSADRRQHGTAPNLSEISDSEQESLLRARTQYLSSSKPAAGVCLLPFSGYNSFSQR
jgi:hypothetical protein